MVVLVVVAATVVVGVVEHNLRLSHRHRICNYLRIKSVMHNLQVWL